MTRGDVNLELLGEVDAGFMNRPRATQEVNYEQYLIPAASVIDDPFYLKCILTHYSLHFLSIPFPFLILKPGKSRRTSNFLFFHK